MINWLLSLINVRQKKLCDENAALKKRVAELGREVMLLRHEIKSLTGRPMQPIERTRF